MDNTLTINQIISRQDVSAAASTLAKFKHGKIKLSDLDILKLKYIRMLSLDPDSALQLIKQSVIVTSDLPDFEFDKKIEDYVNNLEHVPLVIEFISKLLLILQKHSELLGSKSIQVNQSNDSPTIANWLKDYENWTLGKDRDALTQINFINTSPNVKILTLQQKNFLQRIIKIYDLCKNYVEFWESIPDTIDEASLKEFKDYVEQKFAKLDDVQELPKREIVKDVIVEPQINQSQIIRNSPVSSNFQIPGQRDMDLSTEKSGGLVFDQPTNVNLDSEMQKRAEDKRNQAAIQAKLEALKKRQGIDEESK